MEDVFALRPFATGTHGLCAFRVDGRLFALDVDLVSEVVALQSVLPVPMSPPFVQGLFNLRGGPIVLVDLNRALGVGSMRSKAPTTALVLKRDTFHVALAVDRMEAVLPADRGTITPVEADEHPAVSCFFAPDGDAVSGVVTVLDPDHLFRSLRVSP